MRVIAAVTIYAMFSAFLLFPHLGLPRRLQWAAMTLLAAELFALGLYSFYSLRIGRAVATLDVPVLSAALIVLAIRAAYAGAAARSRSTPAAR